MISELSYPEWLLNEKLEYWERCLKYAKERVNRKRYNDPNYSAKYLRELIPDKIKRDKYKKKEVAHTQRCGWADVKYFTNRIADLEEALIILEDM